MPELPEVETTKRAIAPLIENKTIAKVDILQKQLRWMIPDEIATILINKKITTVTRRAKYLLFHTNIGTMIIHLGMTGTLTIHPANSALKKHDHFQIQLKSGAIMRYNDPRKFGCILWTHDYQQHRLLSNLGPEPLTPAFNSKYLLSKCMAAKKNIKSLIMDSKVVVGVGNIYANESLFAAKIIPSRSATLVTENEADLLVKSIKSILKKSIKLGGTTLKDFYAPDGKPGYFKQALSVYGREDQNCYHCDDIIQKIVIGQRATTFCATCQH